eukprot:scaffold264089_cov18-Prasinocladus_malaysianus.AAC.1
MHGIKAKVKVHGKSSATDAYCLLVRTRTDELVWGYRPAPPHLGGWGSGAGLPHASRSDDTRTEVDEAQ